MKDNEKNLYCYVRNNPINSTDPSGHDDTPEAAQGRVAEHAIVNTLRENYPGLEVQVEVNRHYPDKSVDLGKLDVRLPDKTKIEIGPASTTGMASKLEQIEALRGGQPRQIILYKQQQRVPITGDRVTWTTVTVDELRKLSRDASSMKWSSSKVWDEVRKLGHPVRTSGVSATHAKAGGDIGRRAAQDRAKAQRARLKRHRRGFLYLPFGEPKSSSVAQMNPKAGLPASNQTIGTALGANGSGGANISSTIARPGINTTRPASRRATTGTEDGPDDMSTQFRTPRGRASGRFSGIRSAGGAAMKSPAGQAAGLAVAENLFMMADEASGNKLTSFIDNTLSKEGPSPSTFTTMGELLASDSFYRRNILERPGHQMRYQWMTDELNEVRAEMEIFSYLLTKWNKEDATIYAGPFLQPREVETAARAEIINKLKVAENTSVRNGPGFDEDMAFLRCTKDTIGLLVISVLNQRDNTANRKIQDELDKEKIELHQKDRAAFDDYDRRIAAFLRKTDQINGLYEEALKMDRDSERFEDMIDLLEELWQDVQIPTLILPSGGSSIVSHKAKVEYIATYWRLDYLSRPPGLARRPP